MQSVFSDLNRKRRLEVEVCMRYFNVQISNVLRICFYRRLYCMSQNYSHYSYSRGQKMCRVTQCCCCGCSLETGCKILAILGLIGGGLGLAQGLLGLVLDTSSIIKVLTNITYIIASAMLLWGTL